MGQLLHFDEFALDLRIRELRKGGTLVPLQEQPFQILAMLLEHPGDLVTREQIQSRLWPDGTFVDFEHSVNAAIKRLRAALGDSADHPRFVETRHRRGYRFIGHVANAERTTAAPERARATTPTERVGGEQRPRLVVLPFANLGEQVSDYFSDGLTEEMIAQVGRRCANRIGVLARTSSMLYKNASQRAGDIGEALRADYLVEGSVRHEGDHVRITAQLIETKGETHLWADTYDRRLEDCLAVQAEVAAQIAHALTLELLPAPSIDASGTRHPGAYQAFLRGRFFWNKPGDSGLARAVEYYDQAIALDPSFGRAYSSRARARVSMCDYYAADPRVALELVRADALRALALDEGDADAHNALAEVYRVLDWDSMKAEDSYKTALSVNPNSEGTHRYYGLFLAARGRAGAAALADRGSALDPLCLVVNTANATVRYLTGDHESAIQKCQYTLNLDPAFGPARRRLASSLAALGRYHEAVSEFELVSATRADPISRAWMAAALAVGGNTSAARAVADSLVQAVDNHAVPPYHLAMVYTALDERDTALDLLDCAADEHDPYLDHVEVEPAFERLHAERRFRALIDWLRLHG